MSLPGASRILVIDDDATLQQRICKLLAVAGFAVDSALTATDGLLAARVRVPALIVLDVLLPDGSGTEVCRSLRAADAVTRAIPVLMLSVRGDAADRVLGFEAGADDYVAKPNANDLLRSPAHRSRVVPRLVDETAVALTALEFGLFLVLHDRRDRVQSRGRLLEDVWQTSGVLLTSTVDTRIKLLRRKLKAAGRYIETVRGVTAPFTASRSRSSIASSSLRRPA